MAGVNRVAPIVIGQSTAQTIKGSLRFNSGSSHYLSRTPSAGNRKTWTWAGWVKRSKLGAGGSIFGCTPAGGTDTTYLLLQFSDNDQLELEYWTSKFRQTTQVFRDVSAWFHVVVAFDTTQSTAADRVRLYINGSQVTSFAISNAPTQNTDYAINSTTSHNIGSAQSYSTRYLNGYLADVHFIDGQALGPGFFGFTDPLTGTWRPKRLKDGAPTVNNGTDWAANYTGGVNPGLNVNNLWDGSTSTYVNNVWGSTPLEYTLPPVHFETLEIYGSSNGGSTNYVKVNGVNVIKQFNQSATNGWTTITGVDSPLRTITTYTASSGDYNSIYAVRVDGVIMVRNTTTNVNFGTNGFYLPLDDQDDYTTDRSGKGNNWTANGFTGTFSNPDVVPDSPSGVVGSTKPTSGITTTSSITKPSNYATLNPLVYRANDSGQTGSAPTFSNGNLIVSGGQTNDRIAGNVSFKIGQSGKYYWEILWVGTPASSNGAGVRDYSAGTATQVLKFWYYDGSTGDGGPASTFTLGDTLGFALDVSSGNIDCFKNGVKVGSMNASTLTEVTPFISMNSGVEVGANFGQRPFKFAPPDGYLTLCSSNARPSTVIARPDQYVGIVTYTGNGVTQSISGFNFAPDFVWYKYRSGAAGGSNLLYDTVRGATKQLVSNSTNQEGTQANGLTSFNSNGFTVGDHSSSNYLNDNYVAWAWKAGGNKNTFNIDDVGYASASAAGLDGGSITPIAASVGTKQGFSIIQYQGNGSTDQSISHGLTQAPDFSIFKNMDGASNWTVFHRSVTTTTQKVFYLNTTGAIADYSGGDSTWWYQLPDSSLFYIGATSTAINNGTNDIISYHWHSVPGFSKFGSYTGNGSADGPMVITGFRPRWILIKNTTDTGGQNWILHDTARNPYNLADLQLYPSSSAAEYQFAGNARDILSNGFKLRGSNGGTNGSGQTYIYAAFAEAPSFNLYGGQSNAR